MAMRFSPSPAAAIACCPFSSQHGAVVRDDEVFEDGSRKAYGK